ncbi:glycerophosphodiester phosphodiesterase [Konateibacter massiliensis]|uniref:glycerophosphodiester phosphodiesterase n=1 Tax=Konateibacter massiliensis TaxID=2002841 RepID=UPI000C161F28|nr:glycerophosphodiester phosphodiesterase [Konateibacter massiliensis]
MKTQVWAHRGASGYAPENTLPAFSLAVSQKADGVELDIQLTKDGEIVVIHDETVDRTTDGSGYVKDFTLEELKRFTCDNKFSEEKDIKIATLDEVFELLAPTKLVVNVELKTGIFRYEGIEEKALAAAKRWKMEERVIYSSFCHESVLRVKELDSSARIGLLYSDGFVDVPRYAIGLGIKTLHPPIWRLKDKNFIKICKQLQIVLHVWHADTEKHMRYLAENKIEAIITNYPDKARKIVDDEL